MADEDVPASVTFAFGHAVGAGIQEWFVSSDPIKTIHATALAWSADFLADDPKKCKSIWDAIAAVQRFIALHRAGLLAGWTLAYFEDKPAVELSFIISLPNGFKYRGFVDVVLFKEETGEVMVLELKTTAANTVSSVTYKNSAQAIGYSIVLDALFSGLSKYEVTYCIYKTKAREFELMEFSKNYLQRALWIRELLLDCELIATYDKAEIFPMHGESCNTFFRECQYFMQCTLSTERLTVPLTEEGEAALREENEKFLIKVSIEDLIRAQLAKE